MNIRRSILPAAATLILMTVALTGCSKKDSGPTAPGARLLNSGTIAAGLTFQATFNTAGNFPYHCAFHSVMRGSVDVVAGGLDTLRVNIANSSASGFQPQAVGGVTNVRPGGRVIWTNISGTDHTVTSD